MTYSNTTTETAVELHNLLAFSEYIFEIRACNLLDSKFGGCSKVHSKPTFMTKRGKMGEPEAVCTNPDGISNSAEPD